MTNEVNNQKLTPIVFQGKAGEYFGIWIVNLLLTLATFGIYSAWAKVRRKKYFYNNTLIDNVGFDYHANPIAILKGRIIAFVFFFCYSQSANISPFLPILFMIIFFIALPWIIVRGLLFNARNTSHRGLRFDFVGKVKQAFRAFVGLPMLTMFTAGLIWPYIAHEKSQFMMNNHRFGLSQFDMSPVIKKYYKVYLICLIMPIFIIGILAAIAIPQYKAYQDKAKVRAAMTVPNVQPFAARTHVKNGNLFNAKKQPMLLATIGEDNQEYIDKIEAEERAAVLEGETMTEEEKAAIRPMTDEEVEAEAAAKSEATDGIGGNGTNAKMAEEAVSEEASAAAITAYEAKQDENDDESTGLSKKSDLDPVGELMKEKQEQDKKRIQDMIKNPGAFAAIFGVFAAYALFIFGFAGYLQARIHNLMWNNTMLDNLSFKSSLRARDMIAIYLTNILAIACTLGLATPWAQVRMAKYRTSKLQIVGDVDIDKFVGDKKEEIKATGEEIADFFDVDLSFG